MSFLKSISVAALMASPTTVLADWNGWYGGVTAGSVSSPEFEITSGDGADVDLDAAKRMGALFGRVTQTNNTVFGFEIEVTNMPDMTGTFDVFSVEHSAVTLDLKARLGYAFGQVLPYAVLGVTSYDFENDLITEDFEQAGLSFGVGVDFLVTDNLFIGAEYLARRAEGTVEIIGENLEITHESSIDSLSVRAGFKF